MTPKQMQKAFRKLKWSKQDAVRELEVNISTINRWLNGKRSIPGLAGVAIRTRIEMEEWKKSSMSTLADVAHRRLTQ